MCFYSWLEYDFQSQSQIAEVIRSRYSENTVKRIWKLEKVDYRLCKTELDLQFLCKCDDNNVIPNFLNFRLANSHLKYSSTYKVCQLNLLREEIRQKKFTLRSLQKEFSSLEVSLQNELNLIDFAHVSTLFFGINDRILKSKSSVQQKKFRRYVDDIFLLFKSNDHLKYFQDFLNSCHINMSFSMETEKENKLSFLDVEVIREQGKFTTTVYRKPTFSGVYSNFESFLPSVYKFGMIYTLVYRCFYISSNWTQFHTQLTFLKGIFRKNGYPENFIDKCFKKFLNNVHLVKENVPTVEKKHLLLVLPYLGIISLQTRTKLKQALKGVLNCCKVEIVFKCQARLSNSFRYKDPIPKDLISGVVYKFQCGLCNESYYGESIRHLDIRSGEHIGVSPLTGKKVKPSNNSAICDHLLHCNFLPSFDNFSVLAYENKKYLLEIKESLLIMRDKPSLNRNINSAPLYLFDKVS